MNPSRPAERVLALAGLIQAASMVNQLAHTGRATEPYFSASIQSLFSLDAPNTLAIYESPQAISLGLSEIIRLFSNSPLKHDADIARYAFSLLHLQRKLEARSDLLEQIRKRVARIHEHSIHCSLLDEQVMASLASLYTDTLSTFSFRIQVCGEALYLTEPAVMNKVRALLLAGIRSAVLWRQLGGRRWQLLLTRGTLRQHASSWLRAATPRPEKNKELEPTP